MTAMAVTADSRESARTFQLLSTLLPIGVFPPVGLIKEAGLVGVKSSLGRWLELCDVLPDILNI